MLRRPPPHEHGTLMVACLPRLRRYARALVCERAAADDLVQDTCERAWARIGTWQPGSDMRSWLFSIMHNLHVDQRRRNTPETLPMDDADTETSTRPTQTDALEVRDIEAALARLPVEQREVLLFVALEDMSYEETARLLGIPPGTVMSRLSRARQRMRALIQADAQSAPLRVVK
jgi:RNA polymerase sigma-70 factor (ECF subfamily)